MRFLTQAECEYLERLCTNKFADLVPPQDDEELEEYKILKEILEVLAVWTGRCA